MKYFITGHTGFKGAWLTLLLKELGHDVHGYARDPLPDSLFERAKLQELCATDIRADICDFESLNHALSRVEPDVIIHLAAQPLVRYGYENPFETFTTNFSGTLNLLRASTGLSSLSALLSVTTDKVYQNTGKLEGYVEDDPLGGTDPYSASKAAADVLAQSWAHTFPHLPIAVARAGNVIAGCDVSQDRLVPDMIQAFKGSRIATVRNPASVRPWQHVLDCLSGYLALIDGIRDRKFRGAWNFGPGDSSRQEVASVASLLAQKWGDGASWQSITKKQSQKEDDFLFLDSSKSESLLNWKTSYSFEQTINDAVIWHKRVDSGEDARTVSEESVSAFLEASRLSPLSNVASAPHGSLNGANQP
jgi:CDP-glucose 4,6-dehydratase